MSENRLTAELVYGLYEKYNDEWDVAQKRVELFLLDLRAHVLVGEDATRLVVSTRIKSPDRTLEKARRKCSGDEDFSSPEKVLDLVNDVVGVKVLCKTMRDSDLLVAAIEERCAEGDDRVTLKESLRDYVSTPKASGYRARHFLFAVPVASGRSVVVELQIKTRLQDAWGELTHEDLYRPSGPLPSRHHEDLASTMAGLLWEVDKLADIIARNVDQQTAPTMDQTQSDVDSSTRDVIATVIHSGPKYALALDDRGRRGLIPAVVIRDLLNRGRDRIDVDDFIRVGDRLTVKAVDTGDGYYLHPTQADELAGLPG